MSHFWAELIMSRLAEQHHSPSCKSWDVIVAVVDLEVVTETGGVILNVKVQEVQTNSLPKANPDVPVADLLVGVVLRIARWAQHLLGVCVDSSTFFC